MAGYEAQLLPTELLDMVFEKKELQTLRACSLACHAWRDACRRHLFSIVLVRRSDSFNDLLDFLVAHPHIGIHIRKLYLHHQPKAPDSEQPQRYPRINLGTLVDIVTHAPGVAHVELKAVQLLDSPEDVKARLASRPGPVQLTELCLTDCPVEYDHFPAAIRDLFFVFETERIRVELSCGWTPYPLKEDYPGTALFPQRPVSHQAICMTQITRARPTPLVELTQYLVPGCLRALHLGFDRWTHLAEVAHFLRHFGESITQFTITFCEALNSLFFCDDAPKDEDWSTYGFSYLRNLSMLRFELYKPLLLDCELEGRTWFDSVALPRFLACFPHDLPLHDGIAIEVQWGEDHLCAPEDVIPRPELENALLRFKNLKLVTLCSTATYDEKKALAIGAAAFPRLWEAQKLGCMVEVDDCCP